MIEYCEFQVVGSREVIRVPVVAHAKTVSKFERPQAFDWSPAVPDHVDLVFDHSLGEYAWSDGVRRQHVISEDRPAEPPAPA